MNASQMFAAPLSRRHLIGSGLWLGAGAAIGGLSLPGAAWARGAQWAEVGKLANAYVAAGKVASVVAAIGRGQAAPDVVAAGTLAFGQATLAGIDSLYRIYSMTKPITGMAAMLLVDEGRIALDQPIADFLPAFATMRVQKTPDGSLTDTVAAERPITTRNLLTHTAGLGYGIIQKGPIRQAYMDAGLAAGQLSRMQIPEFSGGPQAPSLAAFADRLAKLPLVYQPGTTWSYSVGLDLLGRVIEVAGGKPFDAFLQERILGPAGMTSTFFRVPASETGRLTTNYAFMGAQPLPVDPGRASVFSDGPPFPMGGAGLVSSARDYDRFLRMLLGFGVIDGKRVMSERAVRLGTSNLLPAGIATAGTMIAGAGFGAGGRVGLGAQAGTYGWGGAAGTLGFLDFRHSLRATMMTQYMPSGLYPLTEEFKQALLRDLATSGKRA